MLKQASKIIHSPISAIDESQRSSYMFVSLEEFQLTLHVLKRSLHFHFTATISKLFNVVIYREYNLVWKHSRSIRNDGKGFHSPIFVLDESHCTHDECSKLYFTLMSLDRTIFPFRGKDFYTKCYRIRAFRKLQFRLQIQCASGLLMVLKLAKISPSSQELR